MEAQQVLNDFEKLKKYFDDCQRRYTLGELRPTSKDGEQAYSLLLKTSETMAALIRNLQRSVALGGLDQMPVLIEAYDFQTRLVLMMGTWNGFRDGQIYFIERASCEVNYLS